MDPSTNENEVEDQNQAGRTMRSWEAGGAAREATVDRARLRQPDIALGKNDPAPHQGGQTSLPVLNPAQACAGVGTCTVHPRELNS